MAMASIAFTLNGVSRLKRRFPQDCIRFHKVDGEGLLSGEFVIIRSRENQRSNHLSY